MNEIGDDYPLRPKPSKGPLLDHLAHWLDRKTRTDYETDKPLIESEGPVLVERLAQARVTLTFMGAFRFTWDEVAVIAIRERLPIYSGGIAELVDISLTASDTLRKVEASLDGGGRLYLRIPRGIGRGRNARARANRRIRITSSRAGEILALIRDARRATLGYD